MYPNLIIAALIALVLFLIWFVFRLSGQGSQGDLRVLTKDIDEMRTNFVEQMALFNNQMNERLKEQGRTGRRLEDRLDATSKSYVDVSEKISKLSESSNRIFEIGKDMASLQDILGSPKVRGNLGELFLGDLLGQFFPKEKFELQYAFKSGEIVDAVLKLKDDYLVPIDAKFPLENFVKMLKENEPLKVNKLKNTFIRDVKKHIDAISKKYILPNENTLDFALMYVPAENVYYEMMVNDNNQNGISEYAMQKKVIPVSPNNFYIYLQTILLGLRGFEIEKNAKNIQANLKGLEKSLQVFNEDFSVLGTHLQNAKNKYDESEKKLFKLDNTLEMIGSGKK